MAKKNNKTIILIVVIVGFIMITSIGEKEGKKQSGASVMHNYIDFYTAQSCTSGGCSAKVCKYVSSEPNDMSGYNLNQLEGFGDFYGSCEFDTMEGISMIQCPSEWDDFFGDLPYDVLMILDMGLYYSTSHSCNEWTDSLIEDFNLEYISNYKGKELYQMFDNDMIWWVACSANDKYAIITTDAPALPTCAEEGGTCCSESQVCDGVYIGDTLCSTCCFGECIDEGQCMIIPKMIFVVEDMFDTINPPQPPASSTRVIERTELSVDEYSFSDKGLISYNGELSVTIEKMYISIFAQQSYDYYPSVEFPIAGCEANRVVVGQVCEIDKSPTITIFDEYGVVQTPTSNAQEIGPTDEKDMTIKIKVAADSCYGAPGSTKYNQICFEYDKNVYSSISVATFPSSAISYSVYSQLESGNTVSCFNMPLLSDLESINLPVTIISNTDPTSNDNIKILLNDASFDIDESTLVLINNFEDESNNDLGAPIVEGTIYVE